MVLTPKRLAAAALLFLGISACDTAPPEGEGLARGEVLYGACVKCHGEDGSGTSKVLAPSIAGLGSWYLEEQLRKFKSGERGTNPKDLGGLKMRPMAKFLRTKADIKAVSAYIAAMPPVKPASEGVGEPARGKKFFTVCAGCHGPSAAGMKATKAPALNHSSDWYLVAELMDFRFGTRGTVAGDATGAQMRAMAQSLPDEQAIQDLVAYIMLLK